MTNEEKIDCQNKYYATPIGKEMKTRFIRLRITGIVGILFAIFLVISGYMSQEINVWTWIWASILTVFSIVYIVSSFTLRNKCFNNYAVNHIPDKSEKKKGKK